MARRQRKESAMVNQAEFDLRVATHYATIAQGEQPIGQRLAMHRAHVPGALAMKLRSLTARFTPHPRHTVKAVAATGTAHS
jgi:hypothetical protein